MSLKTVISASRRTDIPAFYLGWFMQAIRQGHVEVANPLYPHQKRQVSLLPRDVAWIVFWSRNYTGVLKNRAFFEAYELFFHFTIVSHSRLFEPVRIPLDQTLDQAEQLASAFGPERIIWRYDPVIVWEKAGRIASNYQRNEFERICRALSETGIRKCYFSFMTLYRKAVRRIRNADPEIRLGGIRSGKKLEILNDMRQISGKYGVDLFGCSDDWLASHGVTRGSCISGERLNQLTDQGRVTAAKAPGRKACCCTRSIDIGSYSEQPCPYGCLYCYANPVRRD